MPRRKNNQPKKNTHHNIVQFSVHTDNVFEVLSGRKRAGVGVVSDKQNEYQISSGELSSSQESNSQSRSQNVPHPNRNQQTGPMIMRNQSCRRFRPGTVALREIRRYQKSTELLISRASFRRLVKEILQEKSHDIVRIQSNALEALQHATENYFVDAIHDANLCAIHAHRQTVMINDVDLVKRINKKILN